MADDFKKELTRIRETRGGNREVSEGALLLIAEVLISLHARVETLTSEVELLTDKSLTG